MKPVVPFILTFSTLMSVNAFADVNYLVDLTSPEHHLAKVEVNFPKTELKTLVVNLPVW